jgi:hypothetical protein
VCSDDSWPFATLECWLVLTVFLCFLCNLWLNLLSFYILVAPRRFSEDGMNNMVRYFTISRRKPSLVYHAQIWMTCVTHKLLFCANVVSLTKYTICFVFLERTRTKKATEKFRRVQLVLQLCINLRSSTTRGVWLILFGSLLMLWCFLCVKMLLKRIVLPLFRHCLFYYYFVYVGKAIELKIWTRTHIFLASIPAMRIFTRTCCRVFCGVKPLQNLVILSLFLNDLSPHVLLLVV